MPAARLPIMLDRSGTFTQTFTRTDDAGNPVAIGGQGVVMTVYDGLHSTVVCTLTDTNGRIVVEPGGAVGQLDVTAQSGDTGSLRKTGMYLLQLVATDGTPTDLFYGPVRLGWRGMGI
jgi:hypothetical protein